MADDLEETKRIMERLVRTPPKPHRDSKADKLKEGAREPSYPQKRRER